MADQQIAQRLGFEAGNAISVINNMATALGKLNTKIRAFHKAAGAGDGGSKVIKGFRGVGEAASKAGAKVDEASKKFEKFGKDGKKGVQAVTFAWQGLAKALVARTAVQALTAMTGAIKDSAEAAAEFELAIARISNIAQGPGSSIDALTSSLSKLAVELGRPQAEVAEAAFEALQNDLGTTIETMDLLAGAANNLALVTGGTLTQSINSLSSVLKAYNLPLAKADEISDQFFAAIDKGRITLKELENSLGKITPLAAKLDIEFGQVAGAMAAITQSGTSASVANTQLRSIFQKLIRPTEELQGAFNKLGVDTFNQLIERSGGLREALQSIAAALDNDDKAIAKAFGRLRGQLGVFNLLANEGKIFADTMDAVADSAGKAAEGAATVDGTNARKAQKAWAKFDETMRQVGEEVLVMKTAFIEVVNAIIPNGKIIVSTMKGIAIAVAAVTAGFIAMKVAAIKALIAAGATPVGAIFVGIGVAIAGAAAALDYFYQTFDEKMKAIEDRSVETQEKIIEDSKKAQAESNKGIEKLLAERGETVDKYIKGMEAAFDRETAALQQSAKMVTGALNDAISDFTSGMEGAIDSMKSKLKGIDKDLKAAKKSQRSAREELDDFNFENAQKKGVTAWQALDNRMARADKTAKNLEKSMKEALSNPEAIGEAEQDIERLRKQADELLTLAEKEKNPVKKRELEDKGTALKKKALEAAVALEDSKVKKLTEQATVVESQLNMQKQITTEIGQQVTKAKELMGVYDKAGKLKSPAQQEEDAVKFDQVSKNVDKLLKSLDAGLFETFGKKATVDKLVQNLSESFNTADFQFDNIRSAIEAKINEGDFKVFADVVLNFESSGDQQIDQAIKDRVQDAGGNPVAQAEAIREGRVEALRAQEAAEIAHADAQKRRVAEEQKLIEQGNLALEARPGAIGQIFQKVTEGTSAASELWKQFKAVTDTVLDPATTAEKLATLDTTIEALKKKIAEAADDETISQNMADAMQKGLETAESVIKEKTLEIQIEAKFNTETMETLKKQIGEATRSGEDGANDTATAVGRINTALGTTISKTNAATKAMNALAKAAEAAAKAAAKANGGGLYHGGRVAYRASGGPTRGMDTQLTATSPGEFVMNSRSSSKFFSELQAMNAGQSPQYRDKGGPVTNIGDINVNVTSDSAAPQLGRQIARDLERELRFKTSTL